MHPRTLSDLKRLAEIEKQKHQLYLEAKSIKKSCKHLDSKLSIIETLAYEFTPVRLCVVCGRRVAGAISIEDRETCLKDFLKEEIDEGIYSEKDIKQIALKGGYNL